MMEEYVDKRQKDREREGASICSRERGAWREGQLLRLRGRGVRGAGRAPVSSKKLGWDKTILCCSGETVNGWVFRVILLLISSTKKLFHIMPSSSK